MLHGYRFGLKAARHSAFHHLEVCHSPTTRSATMPCNWTQVSPQSRPSLGSGSCIYSRADRSTRVLLFVLCLVFPPRTSKAYDATIGLPRLGFSKSTPRSSTMLHWEEIPCTHRRPAGRPTSTGVHTGTTVILYTFFGFDLFSNGLPGTSTCPLREPDRFSRTLNTTTLQVVTSLITSRRHRRARHIMSGSQPQIENW